jgi:hypothetical protein
LWLLARSAKWTSKKLLLARSTEEVQLFLYRRARAKKWLLSASHRSNTNYYKTIIELLLPNVSQNGSSSSIEVVPHEEPKPHPF